MRGYDRHEMYEPEEFDDYEDEGEEEFDQEYEEREAPKPTKEELDYLGIREKFKEAARRKLMKENGVSFGNSLEKKKRQPRDDFGSFFGPSQPVIAQRVIQESKSLLENQHLADRISNSNTVSRKAPTSTNNGARPAIRPPQPSQLSYEAKAKLKAQKLKDNRDYSSLFSDDAELPAPRKDSLPRNIPMRNSDARSAEVQGKSRPSTSSRTKSDFFSGRDERRPVSTNSQRHQVASGSRPSNVPSAGIRKQPGSNNGSGPGRPVGPKGMPSKTSAPSRAPMSNNRPSLDNKKPSLVGTKKPVVGMQRAPISRPHSSVQRPHHEPRRDVREPERARSNSKMPVTTSRPQGKLPYKPTVSRPPMQADRPRKGPSRPFDDDDPEDAFAELRKMFRYDPRKYAGVDDDDSDMEAGFSDIEREEKRSARIAKREDEEELLKSQEEDRLERLKAKRRKLSRR
ncbi:starch synthase [Ranunculus cassubicifolius]